MDPIINQADDLRKCIEDYLNGNPDNFVDIGEWDISSVTDFNGIFSDLIDREDKNTMVAGISRWKVNHVKSMAYMFVNCDEFNQPLNSWEVQNVKFMQSMFEGCLKFNQPLDKWDVHSVKNMNSMFEGCIAFNHNLEGWDVYDLINMTDTFKDCYSLVNKPRWYILGYNFLPKTKDDTPVIPQITPSTFIVGESLPRGVTTDLPEGVSQFDPYTLTMEYIDPQVEIAVNHWIHSSSRDKMLMREYHHTTCFDEELDCYVANRLTSYLLTSHPELRSEYPEYADPLTPEPFTTDNPVVFKNRNITLAKIKAILKGARDFNKYLKTFPPLNEEKYPDGYYVYRGKEYQGEMEKLTIGQTFLLSKITSTSLNVEICKSFTTAVMTKYEKDGNVVQEPMGFFWRIKIPTGFPFAYIQEKEEEVCLPLGTGLRYLGCHVQPAGLCAIYRKPVTIENFYSRANTFYGAFLCEFEVVSISPKEVFLNRLIKQVDKDFVFGKFDVIAQDVMPIVNTWDLRLKVHNIGEDEAFGMKKRSTRRKRKTQKKAKRTIKKRRRTHKKTHKHHK